MKLRVVTQEDIELLQKWVAREDLKESARVIDPDLRKPCEILIIETHKAKSVGWTSLYNIDNQNQTCHVGMVIVETEGSKIALQAMIRTLFYAFTSLNIHRVEARVLETNERCLKLISHGKSPWGSSFNFEGTLKERIKNSNGFTDVKVFSISKEEFLRGDNNGRLSHGKTERGSARSSDGPESNSNIEHVNANDAAGNAEFTSSLPGVVYAGAVSGNDIGAGSDTTTLAGSYGYRRTRKSRKSTRSSVDSVNGGTESSGSE